MRIELYEANDARSLGGTPELWMRVLSDKLPDLPTAVSALDSEQTKVFAEYHSTPDDYWQPDRDDRDHDFAHEDWWIFRKRNED